MPKHPLLRKHVHTAFLRRAPLSLTLPPKNVPLAER